MSDEPIPNENLLVVYEGAATEINLLQNLHLLEYVRLETAFALRRNVSNGSCAARTTEQALDLRHAA